MVHWNLYGPHFSTPNISYENRGKTLINKIIQLEVKSGFDMKMISTLPVVKVEKNKQ